MGKDIERDKMLVTLLAWNQFNPDKSGLRTRRILPGQCSRTYSPRGIHFTKIVSKRH